MKFGVIPIDEAVGAILAHKIELNYEIFKKGRRLSESDCERLSNSNVKFITAARLDIGDVHEDEAAAQFADAVAGEGVSVSNAFTGRCNLVAGVSGLVAIDPTAINNLNRIDESVTVATVPDLTKVESGQVIATIKVIPFAVTSEVLKKVKGAVNSRLSVKPFRAHDVVLINTTLPTIKPSVMQKTTELTRRRINAVGGTIQDVLQCDHAAPDVKSCVGKALNSNPDLVIIVGASVTVDRADVIPAGIVAAGGTIMHFGMPVDPGNLMLLAEHKSTPLLVLPGCARSPKLNGIDWILERLSVGLEVQPQDIMALGVGGLLVDSPARPLPREEAVRQGADMRGLPKIAAVVLAAGQSRRMGGVNKLLKAFDGKPLIRKTVETALASKVTETIVVAGHQYTDVASVVEDLPVSVVHNTDYESGLSTSLRAGLHHLPDDIEGVLICLGDMPNIEPSHLNAPILGRQSLSPFIEVSVGTLSYGLSASSQS